LAGDSEGESLKRYATARSTPGSVAMSCATTKKEERGDHKIVERADIAQLLISRQGEFFPEEFLMAVDLQHLRRVHERNSSPVTRHFRSLLN
jgi:hypothetical protein